MEKMKRSETDMREALKQHLDLLGDYIAKLKGGDYKYYKSIMAELRVLVYHSNSNHPLLIDTAKRNNITPLVNRDVAPHRKAELMLDEFLQEIYFVGASKGERLTKIAFIAKAAQQDGSAHEDPSHGLDYVNSKGNGLLVGGLPPNIRAAIGIAECIYNCGRQVLKVLS